MATPSVKTVQFIDTRIEPQPDPVYQYVIGPLQNQFYKINQSGLSNSNITFNNLTTLGIDRAYLDTFEIELTAEIRFKLATKIDGVGDPDQLIPAPDEWTFQSFPFNTCCDEARVNINGGSFFSQPLCYVRAKERYMNQKALSDCYTNLCPCHRPMLQTESGRNYYTKEPGDQYVPADAKWQALGPFGRDLYKYDVNSACPPTRLGVGMHSTMQSEEGLSGGFNNDILILGKKLAAGVGWENYHLEKDASNTWWTVVNVTWREPLFVSPFSSRYDATYGRPLYNITSMDFSFTMQNLGNMIRVANLGHNCSANADETSILPGLVEGTTPYYVDSYTINLKAANLCYQVMTIPRSVKKPLTTLVPYRRFVPYITDFPSDLPATPVQGSYTIRSGTYTLNEIPTAIWVFIAPSKIRYQQNDPDVYGDTSLVFRTTGVAPEAQPHYVPNLLGGGNWDSNKLFGYIKKINITLANTTQILATADIPDLYRIAKANGCEDSYLAWAGDNISMPKWTTRGKITNSDQAGGTFSSEVVKTGSEMYYGPGSVLRLKPGIDIIVPDVALIPGANANNMVLQVTTEFTVPPHSPAQNKYALWLLFEYVGVASIAPGSCDITMNPIGGGQIMGVSPIVSATTGASEGTLGSTGFWDKQNDNIAIQRHNIGGLIVPTSAAPSAEPAQKRPRDGSGGAVIGRGLSDWV